MRSDPSSSPLHAPILAALDRADHLLVECPTQQLDEVLEPVLLEASQRGHQVLFLTPSPDVGLATVARLDALVQQLELALTVGWLEKPELEGDATERSLLVAHYSWLAHQVMAAAPRADDEHSPARSAPAPTTPEVIVLLEAHRAPAAIRAAFGSRFTLAELLHLVCDDQDQALDDAPASSPAPAPASQPTQPARRLAATLISVHAIWRQLELACRRNASHRLRWSQTRVPLRRLVSLLEQAAQTLEDPARQERSRKLARQLRQLEMLEPALLTYGELAPSAALVALRIEPLRIGQVLRACVWEASRSVLAISECLSVAGNAGLLGSTLGLEDADQLLLPHPTPGLHLLEHVPGTTLVSALLERPSPQRALVITSSPKELHTLRSLLPPETCLLVCLSREQLEAARERLEAASSFVLVLPVPAWTAWGITGLSGLHLERILLEWPMNLTHDPEVGCTLEHHAYELMTTLTVRVALELKRVLLWASSQPGPPRVELVPSTPESDWLTPLIQASGGEAPSRARIFEDLEGLIAQRPGPDSEQPLPTRPSAA